MTSVISKEKNSVEDCGTSSHVVGFETVAELKMLRFFLDRIKNKLMLVVFEINLWKEMKMVWRLYDIGKRLLRLELKEEEGECS